MYKAKVLRYIREEIALRKEECRKKEEEYKALEESLAD